MIHVYTPFETPIVRKHSPSTSQDLPCTRKQKERGEAANSGVSAAALPLLLTSSVRDHEKERMREEKERRRRKRESIGEERNGKGSGGFEFLVKFFSNSSLSSLIY